MTAGCCPAPPPYTLADRPLLSAVCWRMPCMSIGGVSLLLYFGNMMIFSLTFFLLTGAIGFFSAFWFITKIYGAIKVRSHFLFLKS